MESGNDSKNGDHWQRTWDLFHQTLEKEPAERRAFLDAACANDPGLRDEVERLLASHQRSSGILDAGPVEPGTLTFGHAESLVDQQIGPYHLREVVGEGGMGVVYSAEQMSPVRRRVALKLVRPGMDSKEVLARFESERQALAIMNHPRIAKVYDAGVTDDGRPYFVMEYVPGISITEYCDLRGLGLQERLELFSQACEAIDHAHGKGIIHRDIKPSNLLVAAVDGKPSLKVIDFGVAKAMNQRLTERTLFTRQGALVGTPGYMSPEQAGTTPLEVDARTDVYALGVVLYELLVGAQPFDPKTLRNVAIAEMLRIIREEDPPPLWARVTSLGVEADEVAKRRHMDVHSLVRQLRGELEWITMRALDKDATRRYASAAEFASDIHRHLANEPVAAGPPSATYRMGKFAKRHRVGVVAAAVFAIVVVGFGGLLQLQSRRLARALEHQGLRAALTPASVGQGGVILRELWRDGDIMGSPSPDGRYLSFTDWGTGDLALHDFDTGKNRRLTDKNSWSTSEFAEFSVISPDGSSVAYSWFNPEGFYELRLIYLDDSEVHVLVGQPDTPWLQPVGWSPDGRHVLTWLARETGANDLALVSVDDADVRVLLATRDSEQPGATSLSPNGHVLLYSSHQEGDPESRDIYLRSVADGVKIPLVEHPANDIPMGWSPDGRHVLFISDRTGSWGLWAISVSEDGPDGGADLVKSGFGNPRGSILPMGFTTGGSFVYGVTNILTDVYVTTIDADGMAVGTPRKTTEHYEGNNRNSDWSRDGTHLAWISERRDSNVLVISDPDTGNPKEVPISSKMVAIQGSGIRWSPDGTSVLVTGRARNMESWQGIFSIDTTTGEVRQIAAADSRGVLRFPEWSPDGKMVYFLRRSDEGSAIVALDLSSGRESVVHEAIVGTMALSRDGRWIAYTTDAFVLAGLNETPALSIVSTSGGEGHRIFESSKDRPFDPSSPLAWLPDNHHLIFATTTSTQSPQSEDRVELLRIARSGGVAEPIDVSAIRLSKPRIHPDGTRLAFNAGKRRAEVWSVENILPKLDDMTRDN